MLLNSVYVLICSVACSTSPLVPLLFNPAALSSKVLLILKLPFAFARQSKLIFWVSTLMSHFPSACFLMSAQRKYPLASNVA
ncbi:hypothetical protein Golob_008780, partial [Gossypium lobatum]|nr:hypothetical protein [Gossypium lobatum]